jgi:hypothetical protein
VVECFHSCLNRYRKCIPRYEKYDISHGGLLKLACAMIVFNKIMPIYGDSLTSVSCKFFLRYFAGWSAGFGKWLKSAFRSVLMRNLS